jgi:hypothetical protein
MANPEHLQILQQGVEAWDQWRDQNPSVKPDGTDMRDASLAVINDMVSLDTTGTVVDLG